MMASFLRYVVLLTLGAAIGCADDGASTEGGGAQGSSSAPQSGSSADSSTTSGSTTTTSTTTSSSNVSSSGSGMPVCDDDGDGFDRAGPGCCGAPDVCDCDDDDGNVFPDQTQFFSEPRPGVDPMSGMAWDYNCDGKQEKQYPADNDGCVVLQCVAEEAFQGDGGEYFCGAPGTLITCDLVSCELTGNIDLACR